MELNFSNKGLLSFDGSILSSSAQALIGVSSLGNDTEDGRASFSEGASTTIRELDLSYNKIHLFVGGETLRHLSVLDLSYNALATLAPESLPAALRRLNVSHNELTSLRGLTQYLPRLETLEAASNRLTSLRVDMLPTSLMSLNLQQNAIDTLDALFSLQKLSKLNVAQNPIESMNAIAVLSRLPCLRFFDLRGAPLMNQTGTADAVAQLAPRLSNMNGSPLSQAAYNSMYKATRGSRSNSSAAMKKRNSTNDKVSQVRDGRSESSSRSVTSGSSATRMRHHKRYPQVYEVPLEIRLMETKVKELRHLLAESKKNEEQARSQRSLLLQSIKSCASVIDSQTVQLEALHKEIESLRQEKEALEAPMASLAQTFEQTHASLLTCKVDSSH